MSLLCFILLSQVLVHKANPSVLQTNQRKKAKTLQFPNTNRCFYLIAHLNSTYLAVKYHTWYTTL